MQALNPYLHFNGNAEDAFNFYKSVFGGEFVTFMRYNETPDNKLPEAEDNKIAHVALPLGKSGMLMGGDFPAVYGQAKIGDNFCLSLSTESEEESKKLFDGLSQGGQVKMPLAKTFWSPLFGMVEDKFGINWMISLDSPQQ